jgi:hypothetical protein
VDFLRPKQYIAVDDDVDFFRFFEPRILYIAVATVAMLKFKMNRCQIDVSVERVHYSQPLRRMQTARINITVQLVKRVSVSLATKETQIQISS